jgi:hypothetical protein
MNAQTVPTTSESQSRRLEAMLIFFCDQYGRFRPLAQLLFIAPSCMRPRVITWCLYPKALRDFIFRESSLHLILNISMPELAK